MPSTFYISALICEGANFYVILKTKIGNFEFRESRIPLHDFLRNESRGTVLPSPHFFSGPSQELAAPGGGEHYCGKISIIPSCLEEPRFPKDYEYLKDFHNESLNPFVTYKDKKLTYYLPSLLLVEAMCFPSYRIAQHLLSPMGLETLCVTSKKLTRLNEDALFIKYIPGMHTVYDTKRDDLCIAFWAACTDRDQLLAPLYMSIINHTPLAVPLVNEAICLTVYGHRYQDNVFINSYDRGSCLLWSNSLEQVEVVTLHSNNRVYRRNFNRGRTALKVR